MGTGYLPQALPRFLPWVFRWKFPRCLLAVDVGAGRTADVVVGATPRLAVKFTAAALAVSLAVGIAMGLAVGLTVSIAAELAVGSHAKSQFYADPT